MGQTEVVTSDVKILLDEFGSLFEDSTQLVPRREQEYAIRLFEGAQPYFHTSIYITRKMRWRKL